jgi:hypothetical protein
MLINNEVQSGMHLYNLPLGDNTIDLKVTSDEPIQLVITCNLKRSEFHKLIDENYTIHNHRDESSKASHCNVTIKCNRRIEELKCYSEALIVESNVLMCTAHNLCSLELKSDINYLSLYNSSSLDVIPNGSEISELYSHKPCSINYITPTTLPLLYSRDVTVKINDIKYDWIDLLKLSSEQLAQCGDIDDSNVQLVNSLVLMSSLTSFLSYSPDIKFDNSDLNNLYRAVRDKKELKAMVNERVRTDYLILVRDLM